MFMITQLIIQCVSAQRKVNIHTDPLFMYFLRHINADQCRLGYIMEGQCPLLARQFPLKFRNIKINISINCE